jgi:hypothetical protein
MNNHIDMKLLDEALIDANDVNAANGGSQVQYEPIEVNNEHDREEGTGLVMRRISSMPACTPDVQTIDNELQLNKLTIYHSRISIRRAARCVIEVSPPQGNRNR